MTAKRITQNQAKHIKRHKYILENLATSKPKQRREIIKNAPSDLFKTLNLIFKLFLDGGLKLPGEKEREMTKHKRFMKSTSLLKTTALKQKLARQRGGALSAILGAILPTVISLVSPLVKKIFK